MSQTAVMNPVLRCLWDHVSRPVGTLVHIGADDPKLVAGYLDLRATRIVMVNGDPSVCTSLIDETNKIADVEVLNRVIMPEGNDADWYQCTPRSLSGVLQPADLHNWYPRLSVSPPRRVEATSITEFLRTLSLERVLGQDNILVLDTPGLEARLVSAIGHEALADFAWILLRGAGHDLYKLSDPLFKASAMLEDLHYRRVAATDCSAECAWPWTLMHLDAAGHELHRLLEQESHMHLELSSERKSAEELRERLAYLDDLCKGQVEKIEAQSELIKCLNAELMAALPVSEDAATANSSIDRLNEKVSQLTAENLELATRITTLSALLNDKSLAAKLAEQRLKVLDEALWAADGQLKSLKDLLRSSIAQ